VQQCCSCLVAAVGSNAAHPQADCCCRRSLQSHSRTGHVVVSDVSDLNDVNVNEANEVSDLNDVRGVNEVNEVDDTPNNTPY